MCDNKKIKQKNKYNTNPKINIVPKFTEQKCIVCKKYKNIK